MDPEVNVRETKLRMLNPTGYVMNLLALYGWYLVGVAVVGLYLAHKLQPRIVRRRKEREDAAYHKDPDVTLARMQAIQLARERQQKLIDEASAKALQEQKKREEQQRVELAERLYRLQAGGGRRLGADGGYMPLSGGASGSTYRPPKRSACSRGGCGR